MLHRLHLIFTLVALSTAGCADARFMRAAQPSRAVAPSPDLATVIFARPSIFGFAIVPTIVDTERRFIGQLPVRSWFSTTLPPGKHTFIVFVEEQHVMRANLEAGRTYVVEVPITFRINWSGIGRPNLCAVRPSDSNWREVVTWLGMRRLEPQVTQGQKHLDHFKSEVDELLALGMREAAELDRTDKCRRQIEPADGFTGILPIPPS